MEQLSKSQGQKQIELVFEKYVRWLNEDIETYKKALIESVEEAEIYTDKPAVFYYNLALTGLSNQLGKAKDDIDSDTFVGEAVEILNDFS